MNLAVRNHPMTLAEFLDWEDRQPLRYEFDGVKAVAMTGGTAAHAMIQGNVAAALVTRLRGKRCKFFGSDLKIEVDGRIRYPDGFVSCSPVPPQSKVVRDPVVIFEVLSDSTQHIDLFDKNRQYEATPSVMRYIMLSQSRISGTMFERIGADWVGHMLEEQSIIRMPEIDVEVPMAEFYEDIEFSTEAEASSEPSP